MYQKNKLKGGKKMDKKFLKPEEVGSTNDSFLEADHETNDPCDVEVEEYGN